MQEPAQAVLGLASLAHERLAVIDEQPEVARRVVLHGARQVVVGEPARAIASASIASDLP